MIRVHYAQCWEDPRTLTQALAITPKDDVVSIGSAGDNSFALLMGNPRSLTAVDHNAAQIFLLELKMRAIQELDYDDFVGFVGARGCANRQRLYVHLRTYLSNQAKAYWDTHPRNISTGIIHCGKFERYFSIFRECMLPFIHGQQTTRQLLTASSLEQQRIFYYEVWNNRRWRWLFQVFFGRFVLGHMGRDPALFKYVTLDDISTELFSRTERGLTSVPIGDNFFVEYILTGGYNNLRTAHPYLSEWNFRFLKEQVSRVHLFVGDLQEYLHTLQPGSTSKFNLSDIFEYMSDNAFRLALSDIVRVCRPEAKLAYWSLFVHRSIPPGLSGQIDPCSSESEKLFAVDRTFFYESFHLWHVLGVEPASTPVRALARSENSSPPTISVQGALSSNDRRLFCELSTGQGNHHHERCNNP